MELQLPFGRGTRAGMSVKGAMQPSRRATMQLPFCTTLPPSHRVRA